MPDHSLECPCRPCQIRREIERYEPLVEATLPEFDDVEALPDDLGPDLGEPDEEPERGD
jgi:hypothetical protein